VRTLSPLERLVAAFELLADTSRVRRRWHAFAVAAGIVVAMLLTYALVYATNGTSNVFPHVMYVPVIVAALVFGVAGGAVAALAGGALMGPLMPLDVAQGTAQPIVNTIARTLFFVLVAATTGAFTEAMRRRQAGLEQAQARLSEMYGRNLRLFARLVEERDEQTAGHCERVAHNAVVVGRALGLTETQLKLLYWAGLLHDLGKLGVPEAILRKPGRLTGEEFDQVKRHAVFGHEILLSISEHFATVADGVRSHHERWDGRGYPDGLAGDAIPLFGRILGVVDVFEAVTSHRPYRGPMDRDEARELVQRDRGTHFDPEIAKTFLREERQGRILIQTEPDPVYDSFVTSVMAAQEVDVVPAGAN
jgi:uncharacterized integral membrane protein